MCNLETVMICEHIEGVMVLQQIWDRVTSIHWFKVSNSQDTRTACVRFASLWRLQDEDYSTGVWHTNVGVWDGW